jgi:hypothetical protein
VPLPQSRSARALFIGGVILITSALIAVPFALLDDDEGSDQASETAETETDSTTDSDGDGIPDADDEEPFSNPADEEPVPEEPEEPAGPKQKFKALGESANDDGLKFTLESLEEVQSLPVTEFSDPVVARPRVRLIAARLTIKNNGQVPVDPFCGGASGVVLLDERDRNYEAEDNVLDIAGNDSVCNDGVAPGFKDTVTLAFEIPRKAEIGGLVVWNSEAEDDSDGQRDQIVFTP